MARHTDVTRTWSVRGVLAVLATTGVLAGCATHSGAAHDDVGSSPSEPATSCAARLDHDGHTYTGYGELRRDPETTGRVGSGTLRACREGDISTVPVDVAELTGVAMSRAVLVDGTLYVREDLPFPEEAGVWFVAPACSTDGAFDLAGEWLGVQGAPEPRFDGDLRPPYRVEVHVTEGPRRYVGATIEIRITDGTTPTLRSGDVRTSLWKGGGLQATVECERKRFVATAVTSSPTAG
jgi:hypothetical protein